MGSKLEEMLIRHEGLKLKPYRCTAGKITIGVGRNIQDNGITEAEAKMMLRYDIEVARIPLLKFKWFINLNDARKDAIINMVFNLGLTKFLKFKDTIKFLESENYTQAAKEMRDSEWAKQVGLRAIELAKIIEIGKYL
jgi:lysozyme